jgi:hypothetical protein
MEKFHENLLGNVNARCDPDDVEEQESPNLQQTIEENFFDRFITGFVPEAVDARSDIERYLADKLVVAPKQKPNEPAVKPFNVMDWWRDVGSAEYPKLAKVARQFLSVPSSACVERIFNAGKDQYGLRRHSLSAKKLQKLMVLQRSQRDMRNREKLNGK